MVRKDERTVLVTKEACSYLRISRPTYVKYLITGRIKGTRAGRGWRVLKSELDRFLRGETMEMSHLQMPRHKRTYQKSDSKRVK